MKNLFDKLRLMIAFGFFVITFVFFLGNGVTFALNWTQVRPLTTRDISGIACSNDSSVCIAVGGDSHSNNAGVILRRTRNGWEQILKNVTFPNLDGVAFGDGRFIAVGDTKLYISSDNFSSYTTENSGDSLSKIAFGNNKFVAVGGDYYSIYYPDNDSVTNGSLPVYSWDIIFNGTNFIVPGYTWHNSYTYYILSSSDGLSWDNCSQTYDIRKVVYDGNGNYVASAYNSSSSNRYILTSSDHCNWRNNIVLSQGGWAQVIGFCKNNFYAKIDSEANGYSQGLYKSSDGSSWTKVGPSYLYYLNKIIPASPECIGVGDDGLIVESSDGDNWLELETTEPLYSVKYLNGKFYAVGGNHGVILTSSDGSSWNEDKVDVLVDNYTNDITYGNNTLVTVGEYDSSKGFIAQDNNNSWYISKITDSSLNCITFGNNLFIAAGHGIILYGDERSWNNVTIENSVDISSVYFKKVIYANRIFLAVGSDGTILYSDNGTYWEKADTGSIDNTITSVAYGNGKYVAVGWGGTVLTSDNGTSWSSVNSSVINSSSSFRSVVFDGREFIALDSSGHIYYSDGNGENWQTGSEITSQNSGMLGSMAFGNRLLIVCGDDGVVFKSPADIANSGVTITSFTSNQNVGTLSFNFSVGATGSVDHFRWCFGDGVCVTSQADNTTLTHTYTSYGIYTATVTAFDRDNNSSNTMSLPIKVKPNNGDVGSINGNVNGLNFNSTIIVDNATLDSAEPPTADTFTGSSTPAAGITPKTRISVKLDNVIGGAVRVTIRDIPLFPGVENLFYKYVNGNWIDLTDNTACGGCNFTRKDNTTTNTTTISFTITDDGVLDAYSPHRMSNGSSGTLGVIQDPVVIATRTAAGGGSGGSSGGGGTTTTNLPPVINSFEVSPSQGTAPLSVTLTCKASDPDGFVTDYHWDFDGDGKYDKITSSDNTTHTYTKPGNYYARCMAVDNGARYTLSQKVLVSVERPIIQHTLDISPPPSNGYVSFESGGTNMSCGNNNENCSSTFDNGSGVTLHAHANNGYHFTGWTGDCSICKNNTTCTISLDSDKTCSANFEETINQPPKISLLKATVSQTSPLTFAFTCSANDPDGEITKYVWDFDSNGAIDKTTTANTASYTYPSYGVYKAKVTVYDDGNAKTTKTVTVRVKPRNGDVKQTAYDEHHSVTAVSDNSSINSISIGSAIGVSTPPKNIKPIKRIDVYLSLSSGAKSTRITISGIPTQDDMVFYKYVNGNWIDLDNNSQCGNCNFTRKDNTQTNTTTISFTITDNGVLDGDSTSGVIKDPVVVATKTQPAPSNTNNSTTTPSSGGGGGGGCTTSNSPSVGLLLILLAVVGFGLRKKLT